VGPSLDAVYCALRATATATATATRPVARIHVWGYGMADGALAGLRVLECGDFVAAPFAASLLGHLGADVVKIEPPAGDSNRHRGPFPHGQEGNAETSGLHLYLDQAKRSLVLDLDAEEGRAELRRLAANADCLIASGPPELLERRGVTFEALRDVNSALVVTSITPFGLTSGRRGQPMREICDMAAGGWLGVSPGALTDPDLPPVKPYGQQAHYQAGIHAAIATLGALFARDASGAGQQVDISVQAVIASQLENALVHYTYGGRVASRLGLRIIGPWGMVELADGLLFLVCVTQEEWLRLLDFLGNPEWADSPLFADRIVRAENNDALLGLIESELAGRSVYATYQAMQERRIPCTPVNEMADLLKNEHLRAREFFVEVDHPAAGRLTYPGAQWKFSQTPWQVARRAPLLGEHTDEVRREWAQVRSPLPSEAATSDGQAQRRLPLEGVRIADFTWVWAGPVCTIQFAHLGADVIRVESAGRPDTVRGLGPFWEEKPGPNRSGYFNQYNQGKRGVTLNLKEPRGLELAYELVRRSDIVTDNFSAGAMERMGLGYEKLRTLKPDIIQISFAGHGQTGPVAKYVAYGPTQVPMMGLASLTGYPGGGPREVAISYGDPNGGLHAALALLAALRHRNRTGEGQYIDMSQWEAALPLVAEGLLNYQMHGAQQPRLGNRDEFQAPQGVFRCSGDDKWVAISCWSDAEWWALAETIGRNDLRDHAGLQHVSGRKAREEDLEGAIHQWTEKRSPEEAAAELQAAGVPAFPVYTMDQVVADPELAVRDFWVRHQHPECPGSQHAGIPWLLSGTPLRVRRPAPCLGQHTDEVLREVLDVSDAEIATLREQGVLT
jgi:crotonobetainyl-CoA:carnitine CoA-transferase CaiB-like acyl-CoA transferase